jgi:hypothetical protein
MPGLVSFADFILATRDVKLTTQKEAINEASKHTYYIANMLKGRDTNDVFRGGTKLVERVLATDNGSFRFYQPGDEFNPTGVDSLKKIEVDWRFAMANFVFYDEETELNAGDENAYIDLKRSYEQAAMTSNFNGMEDALWAAPDSTGMETGGTSGKSPFSIPTFVNENTNAIPNGFSTLMTIDPSTNAWWRNQQSGYTQANLMDTTGLSTSLLSAMDDMWLKVKFDKLQAASQWFESDDLKKMYIATNKDGHKTMSGLLRKLNNRLVPDKNDPAYPDPMFNGYPIQYVEDLDTAPVYVGTGILAGSATNGVANTGYPRFYFNNHRYMYAVFHSQRYLFPIIKDGGAKAPTAHVMFYNTWYNIVCRSRRRQGIVFPNA